MASTARSSPSRAPQSRSTLLSGSPVATPPRWSSTSPTSAAPALDGVEFQVGGEYLVAVLDGSVRTCGLSGPADPALLAEYQEWFAG